MDTGQRVTVARVSERSINHTFESHPVDPPHPTRVGAGVNNRLESMN